MSGLKLLFNAIWDELQTLIGLPRRNSWKPDKKQNVPVNPTFGALALESNSPAARAEAQWGKPNKIEVWQLVFSILTFAVGIGLARIYYLQMEANRKQADAAENQLSEMRKQDILDQRAWVVVDNTSSEYVGLNPDLMDLIVEFRNTGRTPALNIEALLLGVAGDGPLPKEPEPDNQSRQGMLAPNSSAPIRTFPHLTEDQIALIKSGKQFRLYGTVWYDDIFKQHHWSQFCYKISFLGSNNAVKWQPTAEHNTCDDDQQNSRPQERLLLH